MGYRNKKGEIVYTIPKDANLDKEIKIDKSKIQNSESRTKALTKEYKKSNQKALRNYRKQQQQKSKREYASETYLNKKDKDNHYFTRPSDLSLIHI